MAAIIPFWRNVNELEPTLIEIDGCIYLTSETTHPNPNVSREEWVGGVVVQAPRKLAAQCIVSRTHRVSTSAEIDQFKKGQKERAEASAAQEATLRRESSIRFQPAMLEALRQLKS